MKTEVVLITGASAGIGLATAIELMNKGLIVYAASRRGGENLYSEGAKGAIIHVKMDINDELQIKNTIQNILKERNRLDAVICNAGNGIAGSVEDTSSEEVKYQMETNFFGNIKTIQACIPIFRKQGHGKILTTSSVAAIVPIPFQSFYSAGKAALLIFMKALSLELKPFGIQCCTILPGDTKTEFTAARKYTEAANSESSVYLKTMKKSVGKMEKDEQNGVSAQYVAKQIVKQVIRNKMSVMLIPGFDYKLICFLFNRLPSSISLWLVGKLYS